MVKVAVLAGGRGKRIGREKFDLELCGKPLLHRTLENLSEFDVVIVCRDEEQVERVSKLVEGFSINIEFAVDEWRDFGSIAGVHSAVKRGSCVVTAVDMPFINPEIVRHLFEVGVSGRWNAVIPRHRYPEPLLAFYSHSSVELVEDAMKRGVKRIVEAFKGENTLFYPVENLRKFDKELLSFFNINTIDDLRRAEEICRRKT